MNRLSLFVAVAFALPFFNRFQEVTVQREGALLFQNNTYGQLTGIVLGAIVSLLCLVALLRSVHARNGSMWTALKFGPALFALPALWQQWSVSQYGNAHQMMEIKSGIGGPLAGCLFVTAAVAFVAGDAYLRERDRGLPAPQ